MIHFLKIKNFGPVNKEEVLDFEVAERDEAEDYEVLMPDGKRLLKLAYIYGPNASGKTTFLKAFEFLRELLLKPLNEKSLAFNFEPFLFCKSPYKRSSTFTLSFYCDGIRHLYEVEFSKSAILQERLFFYHTAKPTELFTRATDEKKRLTKITFGSRVKIPARERDLLESNTLHNNTVIGAYAKTNVDIPELELLYSYFASFLYGMITPTDNLTELTASMVNTNPDFQNWMNEFLFKADRQIAAVQAHNEFESVSLDDTVFGMAGRFSVQGSYRKQTRTTNIPSTTTITTTISPTKYYGGGTIERRVDVVHRVKGTDWLLPLRSESSGTRHYFGLGWPLYLLIHGSHMLCIDELENSLHPELLQHVLKVFLLNSRTSQLLITTHSFSLMENEDLVRKDALWFCQKNEDGSTQLYSASDIDSSLLRKGASIINAYKAGRLGAKPNLGSPYLTEG